MGWKKTQEIGEKADMRQMDLALQYAQLGNREKTLSPCWKKPIAVILRRCWSGCKQTRRSTLCKGTRDTGRLSGKPGCRRSINAQQTA